MAPAPNFKKYIGARDWSDVRDAWLPHVPRFSTAGSRPDPGVDRLGSLEQIELPKEAARFADVEGLRQSVLWEAVFLFHKCAHAHLAANRVAESGMPSWAMFNAYHSAYLGARGILALFGIALPFRAQGGQLMIDVYPIPETPRELKQLHLGNYAYSEFVIVRSPMLDQRQIWEAFFRLLRVTNQSVCTPLLLEELDELADSTVTGPRNSYLYKSAYWPESDDLLQDIDPALLKKLLLVPLDPQRTGYLMRLSCTVYRLFEELIKDLAAISGVVREEILKSRILAAPDSPELSPHIEFVRGLRRQGEANAVST